jgi:putative membrane protein
MIHAPSTVRTLPTSGRRTLVTPLRIALLLACLTIACPSIAADTKPADGSKAGTEGTDEAPPPLLDENGNPFPPARPRPADVNAEIAASRFAELAMADALMEIALGELVKGQAESPAVKDLGHRMVTNNNAIKLILSKAAAESGASLPTTLNAEQEALLQRLSALAAADLEREYLWEQTLRQPRSIALYRWQYENCDDKKLKQFAVGTLPIIVVHARVCDEAHKKVNATEIAVQEKRAAAERKLEQERKLAEAQAAVDANAKKSSRKFKK